jgi:uroporphyrinogen III methyltransferase/synthase
VRVFFEELKAQKKDVRQLGSSRIAAIGSGTAKELEKHGLYADLMPEVFDGEHLGLALADRCKAGERILIPRAAIGNRELITALEAAKDQEGPKKLQIDDIATYDTVYETGRLIDERAELEDGSIDYVVFTSASTVRGFAAAVGEIDYAKIRAICIGRQTQAVADALGMQTWRSDQASIDSLIAKLIEVHQEQRTK